MPEQSDILTQLGDVGVTPPRAGDAGEDRVLSALAREIACADAQRTRARRAPRPWRRRPRSIATRGLALGATAAVAAGVAVAVGVTGPTTARGPRITFPSSSHIGAAATQEAAFVLDRVRSRVAAAVEGGIVVHAADYRGGRIAADGSLLHPAWRLDTVDEYRAPGGARYSHGELFYRDGSTELVVDQAWRPHAGGARARLTETDIEPRTRQYSVTPYTSYDSPDAQPSPGPFTDPAGIQRALRDGRVTERGTTTVDGTRAIVLSAVAANAPGNPNTDIVLYVDASSDRVLRTISYQVGFPDITVSDWAPATAGSIAAAKDASVPDGYSRTSAAAVAAATRRR